MADPTSTLAARPREPQDVPEARRTCSSGIRGPLAVEGGTTAADRSLRAAIMLPGEAQRGRCSSIAPQPPES